MIEIQNLSKKFGDLTALNDISFKLDTGVLGVCGKAGSGKSTLLSIIAGILPASDGKVFISDSELPDNAIARAKLVGYLDENAPVFKEMTPCEFLMFVGEAKKIPYEKLFKQVNEVIELTELTAVKDTYIEHLTFGERKILCIAQTLLGNPKVVVLDSPLLGLNAREASTIKAIIKMLGEIKTVVISSRGIKELSGLSSKIALLENGELVAFASADELLTINTDEHSSENPEQEPVETNEEEEVE